ncbi:GSCOCG00000629001-RA-CDS [Cotesia congregata]|uniref:Protein CNPPD1 n=1 Tax=Cotesia congregata TaxID=51543 RepID=A0A8J2MEL1_COTCN|nr:GSCOCG00000629001-RA-CDS [Cotesia congregata]CAG5087346.1 Similar to CNPPD1: Protein CNPPD1 (Gallus gallus) [Cotesia congregata]
MSNTSRGKRLSRKLKTMGDHNLFLNRITKSLYYSKLPMTDRLSLPVTEFAAELFSEVKSGCSLERLDVEEASRISRNACVSPCSFVLALLYLERLKDCNPEYLYKAAPAELFLVSLMVASKFLNDDGEDDEVFNVEWAKSGDLTLAQMNRLEMEFLDAINWSIYVNDKEFWNRLRKLEELMAYKEAKKRGWFSYTEIICLMDTIRITAIINTIFNISTVCVATYAIGLITLFGSALITSHIPGTYLALRQSSKPATLNESELIVPETELIEETELPDDFLKCNVSCNNCIVKTPTSTSPDKIGWVSTIINWFSKTQLKFENDKLKNPEAFITNSQSLLRDHILWENIIVEINWKDTLRVYFEYP